MVHNDTYVTDQSIGGMGNVFSCGSSSDVACYVSVGRKVIPALIDSTEKQVAAYDYLPCYRAAPTFKSLVCEGVVTGCHQSGEFIQSILRAINMPTFALHGFPEPEFRQMSIPSGTSKKQYVGDADATDEDCQPIPEDGPDGEPAVMKVPELDCTPVSQGLGKHAGLYWPNLDMAIIHNDDVYFAPFAGLPGRFRWVSREHAALATGAAVLDTTGFGSVKLLGRLYVLTLALTNNMGAVSSERHRLFSRAAYDRRCHKYLEYRLNDSCSVFDELEDDAIKRTVHTFSDIDFMISIGATVETWNINLPLTYSSLCQLLGLGHWAEGMKVSIATIESSWKFAKDNGWIATESTNDAVVHCGELVCPIYVPGDSLVENENFKYFRFCGGFFGADPCVGGFYFPFPSPPYGYFHLIASNPKVMEWMKLIERMKIENLGPGFAQT